MRLKTSARVKYFSWHPTITSGTTEGSSTNWTRQPSAEESLELNKVCRCRFSSVWWLQYLINESLLGDRASQETRRCSTLPTMFLPGHYFLVCITLHFFFWTGSYVIRPIPVIWNVCVCVCSHMLFIMCFFTVNLLLQISNL